MNPVTIRNDWRTKMNQRVVAAAVKIPFKTKEVVFCGARHFDPVMSAQIRAAGVQKGTQEMEEGFIDQYGTFLTRTEAMQIVLNNSQDFDVTRNGGQIKELYSEGVW